MVHLWNLRGILDGGTYMVIAWQIKVAFCCYILLVCAMIWCPHVDYIIRAVKHTCMMWQAYLAYSNNVQCMYTSACGDNFDCSELI